jgi:FG-GAP repeat
LQDAAEGDFFGGSVAISGETVVVGATGDDDAAFAQGSACVFIIPVPPITPPTITAASVSRTLGTTIVLVKKPDGQFVPITLSLYQKD